MWKERAQTLQQERWGFVQKFRSAKAQAGQRGAEATDGMDATSGDMEEDDEEDEEEEDDDDNESDW